MKNILKIRDRRYKKICIHVILKKFRYLKTATSEDKRHYCKIIIIIFSSFLWRAFLLVSVCPCNEVGSVKNLPI